MERDIISELIDEYNKSAAKIARDKLDNLKEIYSIFKGNYKDMIKSVEKTKITLLSNKISNKRKKCLFNNNKAQRCIFNFLSSTKALIDQSRIYIKKYYKDNSFYNEYLNEVKRLFSDPLSKFVKEFRNYQTHIRVNSFGIGVTPISDDSRDFCLEFAIDPVSFYDDENQWSEEAMSFIYDSGRIMLPGEVFSKYYEKVKYLYNWLFRKWKVVHYDDIKEVQRILRKFNKIKELDPIRKYCLSRYSKSPFQ